MAGAKPGIHVVQLKPVVVPKALQEGAKFIKWDDDSGQATLVNLRIDKKGFLISWTDQNKETEYLEISSIRDTRTGKYARQPKEAKLQLVVNMGSQDVPLEDKTLTIVYGMDFVNINYLNFCCDRREIAKEWTDEILGMAYNLLSLNASALTFLEKAYTKLTLSTDKDRRIPVKNIKKTFAQSRDDKKRLEKALECAKLPSGKSDFIQASKFTFDVFLNFYKHLTTRSEVEKVFEELCNSKDKSYMTVEQLVKFLNNQQRDPRLNEILYPYVTSARARDIINQHEPNKSLSQKGHLSFDGFLRYLMSDDNAVVAPEKFDVNEDMNQPLAHYFINSSHNTYLTGHQLMGMSSVEMYRQCLLAGCRCIELDCWNGKTSEDEPIITHGYTLVQEVSFKEVVEAIAESAFKTSQYPIILSFENHCSSKLQAKMANYCRKSFGDMLLSDALTSHPLAPGQVLPSPNQLLRKIIIKNKKKHSHRGGARNKQKPSNMPVQGVEVKNDIALKLQKTNSQDSQGEASALNGNPSMLAEPSEDIVDSDSDSLSEDDTEEVIPSTCYTSVEDPERKENPDKETGTAGKETEADAELSALVNYIQPVHFHSLEISEKRNRSYEISSFVETAAMNLLKEFPVEFVNYNKRQLSRVYPRGTRVDSSNYVPQVYWNAGCQLVALNFQTLDLPMQLNMGIFEYNGRCGYLLKPEFMRRTDRRLDLFAESPVDGIIAGSLTVKVISGQFLSDRRIGTYVEVETYGLPADTVRKKYHTKTVCANGINPVYDEEPFVFKKVVLPELCVIRIAVYEENNKLIGHRVLPVVGLRPGYRHISLRSECGQSLALATLFVHIIVKDYIPRSMAQIAEQLVYPLKTQKDDLLSVFEDDKDMSPSPQRTPEKTPLADGARTLKQKSSGGSESGKNDRVNYPPVIPRPADSASLGPSPAVVPQTPRAPPNGAMPTTEYRKDGDGCDMKIHFGDIPEALLIAEPLEKIKESKAIQAVIVKMEKDIQSYKKKFDKIKTKKECDLQQQEKKKLQSGKSATKIPKIRKASIDPDPDSPQLRDSSLDQESSCDHEIKKQELQRTRSETMLSIYRDYYGEMRKIREKYHEALYSEIDKALAASHDTQKKSLNNFYQCDRSLVMKKCSEHQLCSKKSLKKQYADKDERARMQREVEQKHIDRVVTVIKRVELYYANKTRELEQQQMAVRKSFEEERARELDAFIKDFEEKLKLLHSDNVDFESTKEVTPL